jgi:hypothetical protein
VSRPEIFDFGRFYHWSIFGNTLAIFARGVQVKVVHKSTLGFESGVSLGLAD